MLYFKKLNYQKYLIYLVIIFIFLSSILFLNNRSSTNYPNTIIHTDQIEQTYRFQPIIQDEYHTLVSPLRRMYGVKYDTLRVGSTTKLLTQILSPIAVIYMNSKLGGEHTVTETTHQNSGYSYIQNTFEKFDNKLLPFIYEPNLQHFRYFLLFLRNLLYLSTVFLISRYFYTKKTFLAGLFFIIASIHNVIFVNSSINLYIDTTNYILMNLVILTLLYFQKYKKTNLICFAIFSALLLGNTLGNLLYIPIYALFVIYLIKPNIKTFLLTTALFIFSYLFFNFYEITWSSSRIRGLELLDQQLWNIWHLQTGHYFIEPSGIPMVARLFRESLPWSLLPLFLIFSRLIKDKLEKDIFYLANIVIFISFLGIYSASHYRLRNFSHFFAFGIVAFAIFIANIEKTYFINNKIFKNFTIISCFIFIIFNLNLSFQTSDIEYNKLKERYGCEFTGGLNFNDKRYIDEEINFSINEPIEAKVLKNEYSEFFKTKEYDCLMMEVSNKNKFLSTYLVFDFFEMELDIKILFF